MNSKYSLPITTPFSGLILRSCGEKLLSLSITENHVKSGSLSIIYNDTSINNDTSSRVIENILQRLDAYFSFSKPIGKLPLAPIGTPFQQSVWAELSKIPFGETRTYGDVAKILNSSARAVGNACRKNPIQIIVPCHRVISTKGLGGYAGQTNGQQMDIKRWLLSLEGIPL